MNACLFVNVVCCQVDVSAMGRSSNQRISTVCGMSEYDRRTSQKRPVPLGLSSQKRINRGTNVEGINQFGDSGVAERIILN
jgi:hypothetical protein